MPTMNNPSSGFPPRVRFNWGFHDGAGDAEDGREPPWKGKGHHDPVYVAGYHSGVETYRRLGVRPASSDDAWAIYQAEGAPSPPTKYALASGYVAGSEGRFIDGPRDHVSADWMDEDALVFEVKLGQTPVLAVDQVLPIADRMGEGMYLQLMDLDTDMELSAAKGEEDEPAFGVRRHAVRVLMDAAPWTWDPDEGAVRKDEPEEPHP